MKNTAAASVMTNTHTHGLHLSGSGNADDITRMVPGGNWCLAYNWKSAAEQYPGTYIDHAHHHGDTYQHVAGGAYGVLIVEEDLNGDSVIPSSITGANRANIITWWNSELLLLINKRLGTLYVNDLPAGSTAKPFPDLISNKWYRLRIAIMDPTGGGGTISASTGCVIALVAWDGVWRNTVPRAPGSSVTLPTGSSRADVAIKCTAAATLKLGSKVVASITVSNTGVAGTGTPYYGGTGTWHPVRPLYL